MITKNLQRIIEHAYTTTPFYMNLLEQSKMDFNKIECIEELPCVNKDDLVMKNDSFISAKYLTRFYQERLLKVPTSGSTGKCADIYWSEEDIKRSLLPLWIKRKKYYDISPHRRHCYFYTSRKLGTVDTEIENRGHALGFCKSNLSEEKMIDIWEKMVEYEPIWMNLQPSMALLLCQVIEKYRLSHIPSFRYIETTGEMLFPDMRSKIEDVMNVKVVDQYGCNEMNSIAFECSQGYLHCMDKNVVVEILDTEKKPVSDGKEGLIYVTTLHNFAMPLIRYNIGDRGRLIKNHCTCGEKGKILKLTAGRSNDWIVDSNGESLNAYVFARCVENVNVILEQVILQFQIIQSERRKIVVRLVIDDDCRKEEIPPIFLENLWQFSLSGFQFKFEFCRKLLPDRITGKLKWFENRIDEDT